MIINEIIESWCSMQRRNLLIVGAGVYSSVAAEIAADMNMFDLIDFVDDSRTVAASGQNVVGTIGQLDSLSDRYNCIVVAIGNADCRLRLLERIEKELPFQIVSLVSPRAYVSSNALIGKGSIIEPLAVVHTGCVLSQGCIVSAGAVVNHFCVCGRGVHIDCNASVEGNCVVPEKWKVPCGDVFRQRNH